eukprot:11099559-Lingulodinium_polyedra.AAC.1
MWSGSRPFRRASPPAGRGPRARPSPRSVARWSLAAVDGGSECVPARAKGRSVAGGGGGGLVGVGQRVEAAHLAQA